MKNLLCLLLLAAFAWTTQAQRAFIVVEETPEGVLDRFGDPKARGLLKVLEVAPSPFVGPTDVVILPDTIRVWIQHYGPGAQLSPEAAGADLLITCYPELLPPARRADHVLPYASGEIHIYRFYNLIYVTEQYEFALTALASYARWAQRKQ